MLNNCSTSTHHVGCEEISGRFVIKVPGLQTGFAGRSSSIQNTMLWFQPGQYIGHDVSVTVYEPRHHKRPVIIIHTQNEMNHEASTLLKRWKVYTLVLMEQCWRPARHIVGRQLATDNWLDTSGWTYTHTPGQQLSVGDTWRKHDWRGTHRAEHVNYFENSLHWLTREEAIADV